MMKNNNLMNFGLYLICISGLAGGVFGCEDGDETNEPSISSGNENGPTPNNNPQSEDIDAANGDTDSTNNGDVSINIGTPIKVEMYSWKTSGAFVTVPAHGNYTGEITLKGISQKKLIDFIESNRTLFSDEQYETLKNHRCYGSGYGRELLLGMLSLVLENDIGRYWDSNRPSTIVGQTQREIEFLRALSNLENEETIVEAVCNNTSGDTLVSFTGVWISEVVLTFPDGKELRGVSDIYQVDECK